MLEEHSVHTHHSAPPSAGNASAQNGLRNDLLVHDEQGPRIPWKLELKLVVLWTSLGFNNLLLHVHTHDYILVVNNNTNNNDSYNCLPCIR